MKSKQNIYIIFCFLLILISFSFRLKKSEHEGPVNWISFSEAVERCKKNPKMIMIDIFTTWCGPCKMLTANTFGNEKIAKYLNENFYCVKFDAETRDSVKFSMPIQDTIKDSKGRIKKIVSKPYEYLYTNMNPPGTSRGAHNFAISVLQGYQVAYPSIVFISKEIKRANVVQGYLPPAQFEPLMKYYGTDSWKSMTMEEFQKDFKSEF